MLSMPSSSTTSSSSVSSSSTSSSSSSSRDRHSARHFVFEGRRFFEAVYDDSDRREDAPIGEATHGGEGKRTWKRGRILRCGDVVVVVVVVVFVDHCKR